MFCSVLISCQQASQTHLLVYLEEQQFVDSFNTRMIINDDFIRFDDGEGSLDFALYDRKNKRAYNVVSDTKSVLVIHSKETMIEPPFELHLSQLKTELPDGVPSIEGVKPAHYQYSVNDVLCVEVISVAGIMPNAVNALREFYVTLASDSSTTVNQMPADLHEPCSLALNTFHAEIPFQNGLIVREWNPEYSRTLIDYKVDYVAAPTLFELPKDYFYYTMTEFREGRVDWGNRKIYSEEEIIKMQESP